MKKSAIIVAGGSGLRMGGTLSKQYLEIGGRPILMHTLSAFHQYSSELDLVLVIPGKDVEYWKKLCDQYDFSLPHQLVAGGNSRFQSVKNGLDAVPGQEGLVAIHDGVRPFVTREVIAVGFDEAIKGGSAIAVVPLKDSIRRVGEDGTSSFQVRENFRLVQTPQIFLLSKIKQAFEVEEQSFFTDEATVYEHQGWKVHLYRGDPSNIKITTPEDLEFADFAIRRKI
jgi:2-C-methyl-D-erythritol 4-phosphate cytidylyltransferase